MPQDYRLPDSSAQLVDPKDPLLDATHPFDLVMDAGGSDSITVKVPTGMKRLLEEVLVQRPAGMKTISDFTRASVGHFLKHIIARLNDPHLSEEWLALSLMERAARYAKGYANLEQTVETLADGLRQMLERDDVDSIVDALEEYFGAVQSIPDIHRRAATMEIALAHPNVHRAAKHVAGRSEIVQEALGVQG